MASRLKEEERNERIIRGLLKLPQNRRCINCNSLGPQYVCTSFWTFVCTTCSGIHREFTHRVKSVSMAKFTSQEVAALQEGGNQRAKEIYLKEWDSQRNSFPDSSHVERLRDFIKHVYVDRRFSGERHYDKPPRVKAADREDISENRRTDGYQGGSRSPPYEDRYSERSSPGGRSSGGRSPGYDQESRQYSDFRTSPARPEVVNDWRREDRFSNGRKLEDRRTSDGDPKLEGRSPERPKDLGSSSPPVVRPVREILGENVIPLRISEPPKANGSRTVDVARQTQRTASSSSLGSINENPPEVKLENTRSLIDFDAHPAPSVPAAAPQTHQPTAIQSTAQPTSSTNDNNWASFDFAPAAHVLQVPSNANPLDSVLSQLSVPASTTGHVAGVSSSIGAPVAPTMANMAVSPLGGRPNVAPTGQTPTLPFGAGAPATAAVSNFPSFPAGGTLAPTPGLMLQMPVGADSSLLNVNDAPQWSNIQHQQPSVLPAASHSTTQLFTQTHGPSTNQQPWSLPASQTVQGPLSTPAAQTSQAGLKPELFTSVASQPLPAETKPSGRNELPADLFTATYVAYPGPVPGWQSGLPRGMGFAMQYNTPVPLANFQQSSRSINPFDLDNEPPPVQTQPFPSMASLQGALPNMPPPGLMHSSSLGTLQPTWTTPQSLPYASAMPPQAPPYSSALPPRAYMGPQVPSMAPVSRHQVGGVGSEASLGFVNTDQQLAGRFSAPATPQPFSSVSGNPFG